MNYENIVLLALKFKWPRGKSLQKTTLKIVISNSLQFTSDKTMRKGTEGDGT